MYIKNLLTKSVITLLALSTCLITGCGPKEEDVKQEVTISIDKPIKEEVEPEVDPNIITPIELTEDNKGITMSPYGPYNFDETVNISFNIEKISYDFYPVFFIVPQGSYNSFANANKSAVYSSELKRGVTSYEINFVNKSITPGDYTILAYDSSLDEAKLLCSPLDFTINGDPQEAKLEYWQAKFKDNEIGTFSIDVNGVVYNYYFINDESNADPTLEKWINTNFNWNGWHIAEGEIVNKKENFKISEEFKNTNLYDGEQIVTTRFLSPNRVPDTVIVSNLVTDDTQLVLYMDDMYYVYADKDGKVSSLITYIDYGTNEQAMRVYNMSESFSDNPEVVIMTVVDNWLVIKYNQEEYGAGTTIQELKDLYSDFIV